MSNDRSSQLSVCRLAGDGVCLCLIGEWRMPLLSVMQQAMSLLCEGKLISDAGWGASSGGGCADATFAALSHDLATERDALNLARAFLVVDLTEATYLDSTILGMLAGLAQSFLEDQHQPPKLRLRAGHVRDTVKMLSFDQLFSVEIQKANESDVRGVVEDMSEAAATHHLMSSQAQCLACWHADSGWERGCLTCVNKETATLPITRPCVFGSTGMGPTGVGHVVIAAHETLAQLSDDNRQAFCTVIDGLQSELLKTTGYESD